MSAIPANRAAKRRISAVHLVVFSTVVYALLCLIIFVRIHKADGGHFFFALDDPYIHLALAEQIAHGHYGLNPGHPASPSSSILWPFLLAPFSSFSWFPLAALGLNLAAGLAAAALLGRIVAAWPRNDGSLDESVRRIVAVAALIVIGNLPGLTFLGMEHTLQVMLAIGCAMGVIACLEGREIPNWCLAAAVLGPMVRYENLGLSVALAIALIGQRRWRRATVLMAASVAPLIAFSLFLRHLGLPLLPSSVLVKGGVAADQQGGALKHLAESMVQAVTNAYRPDYRILAILFLTLGGMIWAQRDRVRRYAIAGAAVAAGLHLLIGKFNWFHRYEVYIVVFSVLVILQVVHERPRVLLGWFVLGLFACAAPYSQFVGDTVASSQDIYLQQYQSHRFVTEFYKGNVAVNDLGLVSYRRRPGQQVLDLLGLGSPEVAKQKDRSTQWLDNITRQEKIGLVIIYPQWFPQKPSSWKPLGTLCLTRPPVFVKPCVTYYATSLAPLEQTQEEFAAFVKTLPAGIDVKLGPQPGD